jgi:hypothetical protein
MSSIESQTSKSDTGRYPALNRAPAPRSEPSPQPKPAPAVHEQPSDLVEKAVAEDAVRLLHWGRSWHELGELIARMADRPKLPDVRKILRTYRPAIEARVVAEKEALKEEADAKAKSKNKPVKK